MTRYFIFLVSVLAAIKANPAMTSEGFAGSKSCANCHMTQFNAWTGSHHDLAMQHATEEAVLGDFDNTQFTHNGVTSRFSTRDGKYFVHTDGPDGTMRDFEIAYTFGVEPLQQYLVPFPDGRVQALSIAWDARPETEGGQRWFHLYPDESIDHRDELHWTGPQQNWNYMCADCHTTKLVKGYSVSKDTFNTTWSEINVGCEACHGPGEKHIDWAGRDENLRSDDIGRGLVVLFNERKGVTWSVNAETGTAQRSEPPEKRTELGVCAACHSRRGLLKAGVESDPIFLNHHMPALLTESLYHADGQIKEEVYVWGSFTQSRMHAAGVSCSDCHDPHSLELRAEGDAVCALCHLPAKFAASEHHGHPEGSAGADCLGCHMPETTYMVVDPRHDHSIRIPRPDISQNFGTPNACNQCHLQQSTQWAADAFKRLFPDAGKPFQSWTQAFYQARAGAPQAEISLLKVFTDEQAPEIARATAVLELQNFLSPLSGQTLQEALKDDSPLVRIAALRSLKTLPPANRFPYAGHLLPDSLLAVRIEAGRVLAATPLDQLGVQDRVNLQRAIADYIATQELNADRPESRLNLGNLHARIGDVIQAEKFYRQAIARNPAFSPAYANIADLYQNQGLENEARKVLQQGIAQQPFDAGLHHALGLSLARSNNMDAALASLGKATKLDPGIARYAYVYGIALNSADRPDEALKVLEEAHMAKPNDREVLFALATINRDRGNVQRAISWTEKLLELNPADQAARQLLNRLETNTQGARQ